MSLSCLPDDILVQVLQCLHPSAHIVCHRISRRFSRLVRSGLYGRSAMAPTIQERCFAQALSGWRRTTIEIAAPAPPSTALDLMIVAASKRPHVRFYQVGEHRLLIHSQIVLLGNRYEPVRSVPYDNRTSRIISNGQDLGPDLCLVVHDRIALLSARSLQTRFLEPFPNVTHHKAYSNGRIAYRTAEQLGLYALADRPPQYRPVWRRACADPSASTLRLVANHILELTAESLGLYDAGTGALLWTHAMADADPATTVLAWLSPDGKVVAYQGWQRLFCYDPGTGRCVRHQCKTFWELKDSQKYGWAAPPIVLVPNLILAPYCQFAAESSMQFVLVDMLLGEQIVFSTGPNDLHGLFVVYRNGPLQPIRIAYVQCPSLSDANGCCQEDGLPQDNWS